MQCESLIYDEGIEGEKEGRKMDEWEEEREEVKVGGWVEGGGGMDGRERGRHWVGEDKRRVGRQVQGKVGM